MTDNIAVDFNGVSKQFKKGHKFLLKETLLDFFRGIKQDNFWAVKGITFKINKGEIFGIIGANGSGKSTILKLIAGVLEPTEGRIKVNGRIGPLIELGAGFHPELSGRENIYLNGTILGLSKKEVDSKFEDIVNLAELREFVDTPVKHYSSGMYMRLGFSIAINIDPDILLIDEILSVGDISFQKKCLDKMRQFHEKGVTIVLVTHSLELVKSFCERVILIQKGRIAMIGSPDKIIKKYVQI